uniref:HYL1-like a protein n=1 Tax=Nematostella vectensis TaxID=45351 RepID=U3MH39_NEMVE|nr:HYL1-like a protein [Nematostella vectensis]
MAADQLIKNVDLDSYPSHGFKSLLQEYCQKMKIDYPSYRTSQCDDGTSKYLGHFVSNVLAVGQNFTGGYCSKRKAAEQDAAKQALKNIQQTLISSTPSSQNIATYSNPSIITNTNNSQANLSQSLESSFTPQHQTTPIKSYKNILQEFAQGSAKLLPSYTVDTTNSGFIAEVNFEGVRYKSKIAHSTKKAAEQNAAESALQALGLVRDSPSETVVSEKFESVLKNTPAKNDFTGCSKDQLYLSSPAINISYKSYLQEHVVQRGWRGPSYMTTYHQGGAQTVVQFCGKSLTGKPASTKKLSEQLAAREALVNLGFSDPELLNDIIIKKKYKTKEKKIAECTQTNSPANTLQLRTLDPDELLFQTLLPVITKRNTADDEENDYPPAKRCKLGYNTAQGYNIEGACAPLLPTPSQSDVLSVGEVWKEKKNVVLVGNSETSFILFCSRVASMCQLMNTRTMELVNLEPGHRIVGLDGEFVEYQGKVALRAERCADVEIPDSPDPVLTSCGVLLLSAQQQEKFVFILSHLIAHQVLLQRCIFSSAFLNVGHTLAMFLRRTVRGLPVQLNVDELTADIKYWLSWELHDIMEMDLSRIRCGTHALTKTVSERVPDVLKHPLPPPLQELQARAKEEFRRRENLNIPFDDVHPWGPPKGNFRHKIITTGLHIETPVECAVRELREESGIVLDPSDLLDVAYIDLPQRANPNPHIGDTVRYFLYLHNPQTEDLVTSYFNSGSYFLNQQAELAAKMPSPSSSASPCFTSGAENFDNSGLNTSHEQHITSSFTSTPLPSALEYCNPDHVTTGRLNLPAAPQATHTLYYDNTGSPWEVAGALEGANFCTEDEVWNDESQQKRGVKRRHSETNYTSFYDMATPQKSTTRQGSVTPGGSGVEATPVGGRVEGSSPQTQSPQVYGSLHEECAWFYLDEARRKSPVFEEIFNTKDFQQLLALANAVNKTQT